MEVGVDGNVVAIAFRDGQQRIQLRVLDGPRAPAHPERKAREIHRLVHPPGLAALAAHDLFRQIAAGAAFVETQESAA